VGWERVIEVRGGTVLRRKYRIFFCGNIQKVGEIGCKKFTLNGKYCCSL
jgi:hypothetical protein